MTITHRYFPLRFVSSGSRTLLSLLLTALPLSAQWTVDRNIPISATNFHSVTPAVTTAAAGDTITLFGSVDSAGVLPFSDAQTGEIFPLLLKPGCTLTTGGSTPVYIWNTSAATPNLIEVQGTTSLSLTKIVGINFLGGGNAILSESNGASDQIQLLVKDCRFSHNQFGISTRKLADGHAETSIRSCVIGDGFPTTGATAAFATPHSVGIRYYAEGNPTVGVVGEIIDLTSQGAFTSTNPQSALFPGEDFGKSALTRLVEVLVRDDDGVQQYPLANVGNYTPTQINEAVVTIQGGNWIGGDASLSGGWDVALLARARGQDPHPFASFTSGYTITVAGTTMTGFREDGIYADGTLNGRGHITLSGGCIIQETDDFGAVFDEQRYNGIHLYTEEGYMGLTSAANSLLNNRGNGLYANSGGELVADTSAFRLGAPYGIFLDVAKTQSHENDSHGIYLRNEPNFQPRGWMGGTIRQDPGKLFNLDTDSGSFLEPNGQGLINRCGVSNNGKSGIRILSSGGPGLNGEDPDDNPSGIAVRVSNTIIWNNPEGGLSTTWKNGAPGFETLRKGFYLVPVTHSTMVGNGSPTVDWTIEIDDQNGFVGAGRCYYERIDPGASATLYRTNLWNNIFVRDPFTGLGTDLGLVLNNGFVLGATVVDDTFTTYTDSQVAVAGTRAKAFWGVNPFNLTAEMSDELSIPFLGAGGYLLTSSLPGQFFLNPSGSSINI